MSQLLNALTNVANVCVTLIFAGYAIWWGTHSLSKRVRRETKELQPTKYYPPMNKGLLQTGEPWWTTNQQEAFRDMGAALEKLKAKHDVLPADPVTKALAAATETYISGVNIPLIDHAQWLELPDEHNAVYTIYRHETTAFITICRQSNDRSTHRLYTWHYTTLAKMSWTPWQPHLHSRLTDLLARRRRDPLEITETELADAQKDPKVKETHTKADKTHERIPYIR